MGRLFVFLFIVNLVLAVAAFIDCAGSEDDEVRNLPKLVWILVILLFSPIGPIGWFIAGRPKRAQRRGGGRPHPSHPSQFGRAPEPPAGPPARPRGPDDDPEFLDELRRRNKENRENP